MRRWPAEDHAKHHCGRDPQHDSDRLVGLSSSAAVWRIGASLRVRKRTGHARGRRPPKNRNGACQPTGRRYSRSRRAETRAGEDRGLMDGKGAASHLWCASRRSVPSRSGSRWIRRRRRGRAMREASEAGRERRTAGRDAPENQAVENDPRTPDAVAEPAGDESPPA